MSESDQPRDGTLGALPPHPTLHRYYGDGDDKRKFVRAMFDGGAADYDRVERLMALGTGAWYRRKALLRAGLRRGMRVLDVAVGTGLVAREAVAIVGDRRAVVGLDPSIGMLARARQTLTIPVLAGIGEQIPLADATFDFLSMGYARAICQTCAAPLAEFIRVLRPGGRVCVLEITRPRGGRLATRALRWYMRGVVPRLTLFTARSRDRDSRRLWEYYWDTIEQCVPPEDVVAAMTSAGFVDVKHRTELGIFSEYTARKNPTGG